ncbi:MAG: hypothetical protein HN617_11165 [Planctomycetaceae bacterium]|jgi:hypothetical protein|nr:hypothetical protein [Planctomycetaceae bacterium]MBT7918096.1 hypothetical protein [Planctomycetaceae bacterium]
MNLDFSSKLRSQHMIHIPFNAPYRNSWRVIAALLLTGQSTQCVVGCEPDIAVGYLFHHRPTEISLRFPLKPSVMKRKIRRADSAQIVLGIYTAIRKDNLALSFSARPLKSTLDDTELRSYVDRLVESMHASNVIIQKKSVSNVSTVHYSLNLQRNDMTYYVEQLTFCVGKYLVSINCTYVKRKQAMDAWEYFNSLKIAPKMDSK